MARKTIKELEEVIKELEQQVKEQNDINYSLNKEIVKMQERADNSFLNSALHKQLLRENRTLKATIDSKDRIIKHLEEEREQHNIFYKDEATIKMQLDTSLIVNGENTCKLNKLENEIEQYREIVKRLEQQLENKPTVQKINNERGAGRKAKINDDIIRAVKMLRLQGKSIRAISKEVELSVGTVQKIINEHIREEE